MANFDESHQLREYLCGRQCSVSLLNICFERPLAIIRSEKVSGGASMAGFSPNRLANNEEMLSIHGIQPYTAPQDEADLLREVESKQKKLKFLQQEMAKWKDVINEKTGLGGASNVATDPKTTLDEAKRQLRVTRVTCERLSKELAGVRKRYADEVAKKKAFAQHSPGPQDPRPMSVDSLELQLQGFRLIETLLKNNPSYLRDHTDVLRAFRWLWRSKGRFLRMQFEERISPRYHGESKFLAQFLISYAKTAPDDVDLLFELIRIFLQPSTSDFLFVRRFLSRTGSNVLHDAQKESVLNRFFSLMAGESNDEIKALSLQLVVHPMLRCSFAECGEKNDAVDDTGDSPMKKIPEFVTPSTIQKFISEVLNADEKLTGYSDRLKVGLLQLSDTFLQYVPGYFGHSSEDVMKYCWPLTKCEDSSCKHWAYYVMCRYIAELETPPSIVLQVYNALLRIHHQDAKVGVLAALDLLVPSFLRRLDESGLKAVVATTQRVMFEEANSIAQLAHVFHVVVRQPNIFILKRSLFSPYMVNSLNRLGLPPNTPPENRRLAVSIVDLVLHWEDGKETDYGRERQSIDMPSLGSLKANQSMGPKSSASFSHHRVLLDDSAVETLANFLIRLKILLADPKVEMSPLDIQPKLDLLLQEIIARWPGTLVRPAYFEKVVAMCDEEGEISAHPSGKERGDKADKDTIGNSSKSVGKSTRDVSVQKSNPGLLEIVLACVQVLKFLVVGDPTNLFLLENPSQLTSILGACFRFAKMPGEMRAREALLELLVPYLAMLGQYSPTIDDRVVQSIKVWLESMLVDAEFECKKPPSNSSGDGSRHVRSRPNLQSEDSSLDDTNAVFALSVIKKTTAVSPSFSRSFATVMLNLLSTVVKRHTLQAASKQKQNGVSYNPQSGTISIRQMHPTPTYGILEEARLAANQSLVGIARNSQAKQLILRKELDDFDGMLRSAVLILDILENSAVVYHFSAVRKSLLALLQSILDMSNNLQLLLATVRLVGNWLIAGDSGPFTTKERDSFLSKIASFDFNGLSDIVCQPLAEVVCHLVSRIISSSGRNVAREDSAELKSGVLKAINHPLSSCLLAANPETRTHMIELFCRLRAKNGTKREPSDILFLFFQIDLQGIGGRFWVALLVELLLDGTVPMEIGCYKRSDHRLSLAGQTEEETQVAYKEFMETLNDGLLGTTGEGSAPRFVKALGRLAHGDPRICQDLLSCLLPAVWKRIKDRQVQENIAHAAVFILSRHFHAQSFKSDASCLVFPQNAVKGFLAIFARLSPSPPIEIELLLFLARTYNCWYEVLNILENRFAVMSNLDLSVAGTSSCDELLMGMRQCYRELGESNVWTALALKSCVIPGSHFAASLDVYGRIDKATDAFSSLIELVESDESVTATDYEMDFWEKKWVHLQQQQQQLDVVSEFAKQTRDERMMLECAWRERAWDKVRFLCSTPPIVSAVEMGDPGMKICETLSAVANGKLGDVENLHAQASQLALYRWQFLPSLSPGSGAHARLLHNFHRLVEIRESGQIMVETNNHSSGKTLPDLKNLLK